MKSKPYPTTTDIDLLVRDAYFRMLQDAGDPGSPSQSKLHVSVRRDPLEDMELLHLRVFMDVQWRFDYPCPSTGTPIGDTLVIRTRELRWEDSRLKIFSKMRDHAETAVNLYKLYQP